LIARYIAGRVVATIPVLIGVTLITFLLMHFTAGNYVPGLDQNPNLTAEDLARIRATLGLDQPLPVQYLNWLGVAELLESLGLGALLGGHAVAPGLIEGDFGRSLTDGAPVLSQILVRLPATLELTVTAMLLGTTIAIPVGVLSALRRGTRVDATLTALAVTGFAVPQFWLGLVLVLVFSVSLHRAGLPSLPSGGSVAAFGGGDILDRIAHLILPALVLGFFYISTWSRFVRSSMIEVLSQDYVRTARAKGMPERRVHYVHALRNAIVPLITLVGLELPGIVSGAVVVEVVFGWPGIGLFAYQRAIAFDYTSVMGTTTLAAILVVGANLLTDLLYMVADPRVRLGP
jgi:peptide/nickel transport system permease protein